VSARGHILCKPAVGYNAETGCTVTFRSAESLYSARFPNNRFPSFPVQPLPSSNLRFSKDLAIPFARSSTSNVAGRRRCASILNGAGAPRASRASFPDPGMRCALEISRIAGGHESSPARAPCADPRRRDDRPSILAAKRQTPLLRPVPLPHRRGAQLAKHSCTKFTRLAGTTTRGRCKSVTELASDCCRGAN